MREGEKEDSINYVEKGVRVRVGRENDVADDWWSRDGDGGRTDVKIDR